MTDLFPQRSLSRSVAPFCIRDADICPININKMSITTRVAPKRGKPRKGMRTAVCTST